MVARAWEGAVAKAIVVPKVGTSVLVELAETLASALKVGRTEAGDMVPAML
jgi:ABC-type thiamin/hydroxymethylpyrimidine transport system permease subunit